MSNRERRIILDRGYGIRGAALGHHVWLDGLGRGVDGVRVDGNLCGEVEGSSKLNSASYRPSSRLPDTSDSRSTGRTDSEVGRHWSVLGNAGIRGGRDNEANTWPDHLPHRVRRRMHAYDGVRGRPSVI